ncbi:NUDIX hydrolase [Nocardia sp. NPDC059180]|uniref:NUDIX hydrolase n=1 Tax=Nocardia sp. NPDC059180 TaxID=3346761 RepID=UPI0036B6E843
MKLQSGTSRRFLAPARCNGSGCRLLDSCVQLVEPASAIAPPKLGTKRVLLGEERIYDGYPDVALDMIEHRTFDGRIQLVDCGRTAVRETREETGVDIQVTGIVGIFTDPTHVIHYTSNDEVRQEFTVVYRGEPIGGQPMTSSESTRVGWVPVEQIPDLTMDRSQRKRIDWALNESEPYIDPDTR